MRKIILPTIPDDWEEKAKARWGKRNDPTCLSYWFPKIYNAGLPVPKTILVPMPYEAYGDIFNLFDGKPMVGDAEPFFHAIAVAAEKIGYPCFLRTGQTSGKHSWEKTCYLATPEQVKGHVIALQEFSAMADMFTLDCSIWSIRELLPTIPYGVCPRYGNMPICKEFRFFVIDDEIICRHPYWPEYALERGGVNLAELDYRGLCQVDNEELLAELASAAGRAVGGAWSVDILETEKGWYLTDMAEAHKSFHWEGCQKMVDLTAKTKKGVIRYENKQAANK